MQESLLRIEPLPGYTPAVGRLVGMLAYARATTIAAVDGLSVAELDHLHDDKSNSIGALLAHIAQVERSYQVLTFDERLPSSEENAAWANALKLGAEGRRTLRGHPLPYYLEQLETVRRHTGSTGDARRCVARRARRRRAEDQRALGVVSRRRG